MEKKLYSKPFMIAERFEPQEYCSNCGPTEEDQGTLYAQCGEGKYWIQMTTVEGPNRINGLAMGNPGMAGTLYRDTSDPDPSKGWNWAGPLPDHEWYDRLGEYFGLDASAISRGKKAGDPYDTEGHIHYCNHTTLASVQHHHMTYGHVVYKNQS